MQELRAYYNLATHNVCIWDNQYITQHAVRLHSQSVCEHTGPILIKSMDQ